MGMDRPLAQSLRAESEPGEVLEQSCALESFLFFACLRSSLWRPQLHLMVPPPTPTELMSQPGCQQWDVPGEAGGAQRCVLRSALIFLINATPTVKFFVFNKFKLAKLPSLEHPFWNFEDWITLWLTHKWPHPRRTGSRVSLPGTQWKPGHKFLWVPAEIDILILIPSVDGASLTEES